MAPGWRAFIIASMNKLFPWVGFTWREKAKERRFGYPPWMLVQDIFIRFGVSTLIALAAAKIIEHLKEHGRDRTRADFMGIWMRDWSQLLDTCRRIFGMTDDEYESFKRGRTGGVRGRARGRGRSGGRAAAPPPVAPPVPGNMRDASVNRPMLTVGDFAVNEEEEEVLLRQAQNASLELRRELGVGGGDVGAGPSGRRRRTTVVIESEGEGDDRGKGKRRRQVIEESESEEEGEE